jgi:hypothetical protein
VAAGAPLDKPPRALIHGCPSRNGRRAIRARPRPNRSRGWRKA